MYVHWNLQLLGKLPLTVEGLFDCVEDDGDCNSQFDNEEKMYDAEFVSEVFALAADDGAKGIDSDGDDGGDKGGDGSDDEGDDDDDMDGE
jgi:hypothetical protein